MRLTTPLLPLSQHLLAPTLLLLALAAPCLAEPDCTTSGCHPKSMPADSPHFMDGACDSCHQRASGPHPGGQEVKTFTLVAKGAELCLQCHDAFGKKKVVHYPVQEGECLLCHNVHGRGKGLLTQAGENQTELCTQCHDATTFQQKVMHGPVAMGACTECHNPHEAALGKLLKAPANDLCVRCHGDIGTGLKESPVVHQAIEKKGCTGCHKPHGSSLPKLVNEPLPGLCVKCHTNVGDTAMKARRPHAPVRRTESCGACHSSHFSQASHLLTFPEKELCLSCHGENDTRRSKGLRNIAQEIEDKRVLHPPVKDGCSDCHSPHGSDYYRLLNKSYPETIYAPYKEGAYDFCLQCHEPLMLRYPDTTIYTSFRNGKENLHYLHVVDDRKGRTCRTCHLSHAGNAEKLINQAGAEFGEWRIPVRFKKTETGGSCAPGCHRELGYDRKEPQDNN